MPQMGIVIVALFALPSFLAMQAYPKAKVQKAPKKEATADMSGDASINLHTPVEPWNPQMGAEHVQVEVHALGGSALHAECPKYACQACEKCIHPSIKSLSAALNNFCKTDRKCETGMGDWCRLQIVDRVLQCAWKGDQLGTPKITACVTTMMCNAQGSSMPCETWKQANCPQQADATKHAPQHCKSKCAKNKKAWSKKCKWHACKGCENCQPSPAKATVVKVCRGKSSTQFDAWCDTNCKSNPPNCPSTLCTCSTSLAQVSPNTTQYDIALLSRRSDNKMIDADVLDGALSGKCGA